VRSSRLKFADLGISSEGFLGLRIMHIPALVCESPVFKSRDDLLNLRDSYGCAGSVGIVPTLALGEYINSSYKSQYGVCTFFGRVDSNARKRTTLGAVMGRAGICSCMGSSAITRA
jgi:hypothetical protein